MAEELDLEMDVDVPTQCDDVIIYDSIGNIVASVQPGGSYILAPATIPDMGWIKITKTFADLAAASNENDIEIYSNPAARPIHWAIIRPTVEFSGGSLTKYFLSLGVIGNEELFVPEIDMSVAISGDVFEAGSVGPGYLNSFTSVLSINAHVRSVGGNLNTAIAGSVDIHILISTLP